MKLIIRDITKADYTTVIHFNQHLHELHVKARPDIFLNPEKWASREEFEAQIHDKRQISLLAEADGKAVGYCIVIMRPVPKMAIMAPRKVAYMDEIYVCEEYRKCGVGRQIFLAAKNRVQECGADTLELNVFNFNNAAMNFYKKMGMGLQSSTMEIKLGKK